MSVADWKSEWVAVWGGRDFFFKGSALWHHVTKGDTNASPRLTALCMLRVQSARKPGKVLPPLSGAAGFEPRPPGWRSLRSNQLSYRRRYGVRDVGSSDSLCCYTPEFCVIAPISRLPSWMQRECSTVVDKIYSLSLSRMVLFMIRVVRQRRKDERKSGEREREKGWEKVRGYFFFFFFFDCEFHTIHILMLIKRLKWHYNRRGAVKKNWSIFLKKQINNGAFLFFCSPLYCGLTLSSHGISLTFSF